MKPEQLFQSQFFTVNYSPAGPVLVISHQDIGGFLSEIVYREVSPGDDAGCDWLTDAAGNTYIGGQDWKVSSDPKVAALIDAANILKLGYTLNLEVTE